MSKTLTTFILLLPSCLSFRAPNIGTTIFYESDLNKQCWDVDGIFLLHSRMFLELLLPSPRVLQELDNEFAADLVNYFTLILTTMDALPESKKKKLSLQAMKDIIGGYLHSVILPVARMSYYAGIINWKSMHKLDRYYNKVKDMLKTEGQGWASPRLQKWGAFEARRLPMQKPSCKKHDTPCSDLRIYTHTESCDDSKTCGKDITLAVPIPFFDCKTKPYAVAVPFRTNPLFDVIASKSSYVIVRYFLMSHKCLACKCDNNICRKSFKNNLYTWLTEEVVPRLNDDKTYAAFGAVIRVIRTLEYQDASHVDLLRERDCYNKMAGVSEDQFIEYTRHKLKVILIALLIVLLLWFLLACCILCCRMARKRCTCGKPAAKSSRKSNFLPERYSNIMDKIMGSTERNEGLMCMCDSKTYFSTTEESSRGKSGKSETSKKSSSPRTGFSSSSQSKQDDIPAYSAVTAPVSIAKGISSSSSESRGLPPIEEISERSSLLDSKRPPGFRIPVAGSASDSEKDEYYPRNQEVPKPISDRGRRSHLVHNIQSGKLDSSQEVSRVQCYSDDTDVATEDTESKTDISSDSIENLSTQ
ncbi:hypothetical protein WA026_000374 [Henosepilachna vigintioctopunctata]|uniref:Uncharacterized protein n=1 Tax=Henosepilachna vigintioctopunctata TaxID=420089 RepID=A0AAW1V4R7_9CUCU